jgi:hypothetical protein
MPFMTMRSRYIGLSRLPVRFAEARAQRNWFETAPKFATFRRSALNLMLLALVHRPLYFGYSPEELLHFRFCVLLVRR